MGEKGVGNDEIRLPDGTIVRGENVKKLRRLVGEGKFPPASPGWEQDTWNEGVRAAVELTPEPEADGHLDFQEHVAMTVGSYNDCPVCKGARSFPVPNLPHPPKYQACKCVEREHLLVRILETFAPCDGAHMLKKEVEPFYGVTEERGRNPNLPDILIVGPQDWFAAHLWKWVVCHQDIEAKVVSDADVQDAYKPKPFNTDKSEDFDAGAQDIDRGGLLEKPLLIIEIGVLNRRTRDNLVAELVADRQNKGKPTWLWTRTAVPKAHKELVKTWRTIRA